MFKTKPLIGTPNDSRVGNKFEFTPIGYKVNDENRDPRTNTIKRTSKLNPMSTIKRNRDPFNGSPLANSVRGGSSFIEIESFDTIHYSDNSRQPISKQHKTSSPVPNGFDNHDLLNNGSNPVRQQQENVSKLQDENYNLKVKIASLTRFLNSITNNEQQEIYQQNSELQEKLIEMRGQISLLNQELSDSKKSTNSATNDVEVEKFKDEIRSLNKIIQELREATENQHELEREVNRLHQVIEELETENIKEKQSSISPAYVDKLEEQLEEVKERLHDVEFELNRKNEELDGKDDKLEEMEEILRKHKSLSDKQQDQIEDELEDMKDAIRAKDKEIDSLMDKLDAKDSLLAQLKNDYDSLKEKLQNDYAKLKDGQVESNKFQQKLKELEIEKNQKNDQLKQSQSKYSETLRELSDLRHELASANDMMRKQENVIDELRSTKTSNEKIYKFADDLKVKVKSLEKELHSLSLERDVLQKQLAKSDQEIIGLKNNNERTYKAYNELKKKQQQNQSTQATTKTSNNEQFWKSEIDQLSNQINDLNVENKKLSRELQNEKVLKKLDVDSYEKHEVKNLTARCNDLQLELSEKENLFNHTVNKYKKEVENYKSMIREKEDELRKVSSELRTIKYSTTQQLDEEKLEALKVKSSKEYQIKAMKIELDNLKEEHDAEVKSYKKLIERLKNASSGKNVDDVKSRLVSNTANETDQLLQKINDKNNKIRILNNKLTETVSNVKVLEKEVSRLEDVKLSLLHDNKKLDAKIDLLSDELVSQRKETERLLSQATDPSTIYELKRELKLRENQLEASNKEFNEMKHDLINKYREIHDEKSSLERRVEKIIKNYRQLQNNLNGKVFDNKSPSSSSKELIMTKDQADFYRMKYNKSTYVINDLKFMNSFMLKSIQATNSHIKKDVEKLQTAGIYPDYELICNKKPSLSVLFKFVVAAVRIKRKTEHSGIRNKKLENLKFKLELQDY